jgi:hypothetical protein
MKRLLVYASDDLWQQDSTARWREGAPDEPMVGKGTIGSSDNMSSAVLANGSLDVLDYLYPFHSPIWGCWIVWKWIGVQDT